MHKAWNIIKGSFSEFFSNKVLKLSASLAYFTIFSLPGLLIIIIWVSNFFYGQHQVENAIYAQLDKMMGHLAAENIQGAITNAANSNGGTIARIIGIASLILGATSVFGEIQDSINDIWQLKAKPRKGRGVLRLIINRLLSFSMIITLGFILLVSLVINSAVDMLMTKLTSYYPNTTVVLVYIINLIITIAVITLIFAAIFKMLPDAKIKWRNVWVGAFVTALLFVGGRYLISFYLGHNRATTTYGAAGSLVVVLLWVYYSAAILYFGAAFTHVYVKERGSRIYPSNYAVWVKQVEVEPRVTS